MTTAAQPPHVAVLSLAMVQGAVYDAVNAIDGGHRAYLVKPPAIRTTRWTPRPRPQPSACWSGSPSARRRWPAWCRRQLAGLQPLYDASLASVPDGAAKTGGIEVGEAAASAMLTARQNDGRGGSFTFVPGTDPGEWRPGPPQGPSGIVAADPAPWVGFVRPFLVPNVEHAADRRPERRHERGLRARTSAR